MHSSQPLRLFRRRISGTTGVFGAGTLGMAAFAMLATGLATRASAQTGPGDKSRQLATVSQPVVQADVHHDGTRVWRILFAFEALPKETFDTVYNPAMGQVTRQILADERPDFIIILNFYMLTLATVEAARSLGIPVAHVATDFVPVCRWGTFMRWDNRTCERTMRRPIALGLTISRNPL